MKKGDRVFYKQREYIVLMVDGNFILIKDTKRGDTLWVIKSNVMALTRKGEH